MIEPLKIERRLAAILAADVARYSELMGVDEVGTLNALKAHRRERIDPAISRHQGRIVKTTGDGLLAEFASVVDAVGCAVAIQRMMLGYNAGVHEDRRIVLRIGINLGDIIIDGDDIFGEGVNVAARLEALCEPGGVCISRAANEQVRDKLRLEFADLGERTVKNIARAVGVFGLGAQDIARMPEAPVGRPAAPAMIPPVPPRRSPAPQVGGVVALLAALAAGGWWATRPGPAVAPVASRAAPAVAAPVVAAAVVPAARPAAYSLQDRRESVIVLPFENSSGDPAQDGLAAALTRDITDSIAQDNSMPLVAAATAAAYRGRAIDLRAIGREHDVHFALSGSVRRQGGRIIVAVSTYDTSEARQVWSRRFDRADTPEDWQSLVYQIRGGYDQSAMETEVGRATREHPNDLDKRDLMFATVVPSLAQNTRSNLLTQLGLIDRALALDPNFVWALRDSTRKRATMVSNGFSTDRNGDLAIAERHSDRALAIAPDDYPVLRERAYLLRTQGNYAEAAALLRRLIEREPLSAFRHLQLGTILVTQGKSVEALNEFKAAKRLAVSGDSLNSIDALLAVGYLANELLPEAVEQAGLAVTEFTPDSGLEGEGPWLVLIAAQALSGNEATARVDLARFLATPRSLATLTVLRGRPFYAAIPRLLEGLKLAGMPET